MVKIKFVICLYALMLPFAVIGQNGYVINNQVADRFVSAAYSNTTQTGFLNGKMKINREKRLLQIDLESILAPYKFRPGVQEWTGEHVGKFLHAACLEYINSGNPALKKRIDYAAKSLIAAQLPDGYLGTYLKKNRWTSWDVWSHKYNMIGLLAYYKVTGYKPALSACRKMGDLLCKTFGKDKLDIIKSGTHLGMAPTSILEPMVELYRYTGNRKYLDFCNYIINAWEEDGGPKIISSLLETGNVFKTANSKAYEMMSDLVGLLELYRLTGIEKYLSVVENAWRDIASKRLYIHGTASHTEDFHGDYDLNPVGFYDDGTKYGGPGEGCVTVTWIQLNWQLLKLTGGQQYVQQLENSVYNALLAAQNPHNGEVSYFIPLVGRKRYGEVTHGILPDICCCSSSLPRGIALIPQFTTGNINNAPAVLLYSSGSYSTKVQAGNEKINVELKVNSDFPISGGIDIEVNTAKKSTFSILLYVPVWADSFIATTNGIHYKGNPGTFLSIGRTWNKADKIQVVMDMSLRIVLDNNKGSKLMAVKRGPQILAIDENVNAANGLPRWGWIGNQVYRFSTNANGIIKNQIMVPLADAGQSMADYTVLIDSAQIITEQESTSLKKYRQQLKELKSEFKSVSMPDIKFFLFGMGNRTKLVYKNGKLINALFGKVICEWLVKSETIIPNDYAVSLITSSGMAVKIYENEKGVFINEADKETLVEGTETSLVLPEFEQYKYSEVLKVLHQEILINVLNSRPLPNFFVYKNPWRRDGAMMAMCLNKTGNINLIKDWILGLNDVYDRNNAGEKEVDNIGQTLYLLSFFTDKNNALVKEILAEVSKHELSDSNGLYIKGRSDFHEAPVYQTKWLKYGLKALGIADPYNIPAIKDNYSSLFWWDYKASYLKGTTDAFDEWKNDFYPYIGWAADHFHGLKRNPVSNRDYPLSWEINASQADYNGMSIIDDQYMKGKNASPHTWHAAEMFLYLIELQR